MKCLGVSARTIIILWIVAAISYTQPMVETVAQIKEIIPDQIVTNDDTTCGLYNDEWVAGRIDSRDNFRSYRNLVRIYSIRVKLLKAMDQRTEFQQRLIRRNMLKARRFETLLEKKQVNCEELE